MFGSIFLKECKAISKSIIYFVFIAVTILFYWSQLGGGVEKNIELYNDTISIIEHSENPLVKPTPDQNYYGTKNVEVPEQIIHDTISTLIRETESNTFTSYPFGFYKEVKLNKSELKKAKTVIEELTGIPYDDIKIFLIVDNTIDEKTYDEIAFKYNEAMKKCDYKNFKAKMLEMEKLIGKGSQYSTNSYKSSSTVDLTYEGALKEYNDFIYKDKVTGAYAREFCDYMGIVIALFSIFVPVSFLLRDKKSRMNELIYSREISSIKIILSRYFACIVMMILPIFILSFIPTVELVIFAIKNNISVNPFAYITHITTWLLPTLMVTTSVGFLFTILTDSPIGIIIQFAWSFSFDLLGSFNSMQGGNYGTHLSLRFNTLGNYQLYKDNISELVINRVSYSLLAIVLITITIFLYEQKRKGRTNASAKLQKIFRHNKSSTKTVNEK